MINLKIKTSLPAISDNFSIVENTLKEMLKKYDLVVTEDGIKDAKKMATELNKLSKQIDEARKAKVKELTAPIKEFEAKAKKLTSLCQEKRQNLLNQVKAFEEKEIERALKLVYACKCEFEKKYGIKEGFEIPNPSDLAIVSNLTKTGLSKKARDEIEKRVLAQKELQDKIEKRLLSLSSVCVENGLMTPLKEENIRHFLKDDEENYNKKLLSLIKSEIARQEQYRKMIEEKARIEAEAKANMAKIKATRETVNNTIPKNCSSIQIPKQKLKGIKKRYLVTATFEVEVDVALEGVLEKMLLKKFEAACFKTMPEIKVVPMEEEKLLEGSLF